MCENSTQNIYRLNIPCCTHGKFMHCKNCVLTLQSMACTNHKFPVHTTRNRPIVFTSLLKTRWLDLSYVVTHVHCTIVIDCSVQVVDGRGFACKVGGAFTQHERSHVQSTTIEKKKKMMVLLPLFPPYNSISRPIIL